MYCVGHKESGQNCPIRNRCNKYVSLLRMLGKEDIPPKFESIKVEFIKLPKGEVRCKDLELITK